MYGQEENLREKLIEEYRGDVERLLRYLPWLHKISDTEVQSYYEGDGDFTVIKIPVYDSNLLGFVKEAEQTKLVTKNYPYTYSRYRITGPEQERTLLQNARIQDIDLIKGIISKYVLEGKRKGATWTIAIKEQIFLTALETLDNLFLH